MTGSLPTATLVSALLRRINDTGGMALVRARGDAQSGAILLIIEEKSGEIRLLERAVGPLGRPALVATGPAMDAGASAVEDYWRRRRTRDPDLWVVELNTPSAERFAAETIIGD